MSALELNQNEIDSTDDQVGYFVFSLDTELAWGYFDLDEERSRLFSPDGSREREAINRLLDIFDEFGIIGTWAVVGHLFYEKCEECDVCPVLAWEGKYRTFEETYKTANTLFYGPDVVDNILSRKTPHEIAFHGYTHEPFNEKRMTADAARTDIEEWQRIAGRRGIVPHTVIFPRDQVGHLDIFQEHGFICYRSDVIIPRIYWVPYVGPLLKSVDHILSLTTPPVYDLEVKPSGLVDLQTSQHLFAFNRKLELALDSLGLHNMRIRRMVRGVERAAAQKKFFHAWIHPWEMRTEKDFDKLRYLFSHAAEEIAAGRMKSIGMTALAELALARH